jgi:hypothetical protein
MGPGDRAASRPRGIWVATQEATEVATGEGPAPARRGAALTRFFFFNFAFSFLFLVLFFVFGRTEESLLDLTFGRDHTSLWVGCFFFISLGWLLVTPRLAIDTDNEKLALVSENNLALFFFEEVKTCWYKP